MPSTLIAVSFETPVVESASGFWADLLGRAILTNDRGALLPGDQTQVGLRFICSQAARLETNRLHLHLTSATLEDQREIVRQVVRLGGHRRGTGTLPFGRDIYVSDPSGDEFCVIEPGNAFLAGCGLLGEVTCEGTPVAGRFWRDALGWAVVWDQEGQLAIQAPEGGTKLSWDGTPSPDAPGWNRQRLILAANDSQAEGDRLIRLGATMKSADEHGLLMTDPDGAEFELLHRTRIR